MLVSHSPDGIFHGLPYGNLIFQPSLVFLIKIRIGVNHALIALSLILDATAMTLGARIPQLLIVLVGDAPLSVISR
jgi:hypothetical protein